MSGLAGIAMAIMWYFMIAVMVRSINDDTYGRTRDSGSSYALIFATIVCATIFGYNKHDYGRAVATAAYNGLQVSGFLMLIAVVIVLTWQFLIQFSSKNYALRANIRPFLIYGGILLIASKLVSKLFTVNYS